MLKYIKDYNQPITINNILYNTGEEAYNQLKSTSGKIIIKINTNVKAVQKQAHKADTKLCRIFVKPYMTNKSNPHFDFMQKFNKNIPMPMRMMEGEILDQTKGMYKMKLHSPQVMESRICMKCGKKLTHPVSLLYGIGPECGKHFHINPFKTEEELKDNIVELNKLLKSIEWEGWVIKSSIIEKEEI